MSRPPAPLVVHDSSPGPATEDVKTANLGFAPVRVSASLFWDSDAPLPSVPGYQLLRELGRGGMGVVYEAVDVRLNRPVALKVISDTLAADPSYLARLGDEAEAVARLRHPNVVEIYQVGEFRGRSFLALELVCGESLAGRIAAGPLDPAEAIELIRKVARAVQHAHERGVIHRDLKPANVLLAMGRTGEALEPKVTDFGLAKILGEDRGRTVTGTIMGTLGYIAPELIDRPHAASPASDIYALGVTLFECLTGVLPVPARSFLELVRLLSEAEPPPPSRFRPGLPRGLDAVCRKALAKSPRDRYRSAGALADDLDRIAAGQSVGRWAFRPPRGLSRALRVAAVVLLTGLATVGLACWERYRDGVGAVQSGRELLAREDFVAAEAEAARGLRRVGGLPGCERLAGELTRQHSAARRGRRAGELHRLIDQLRFGYDTDSLTPADIRAVAATCETVWAVRDQFFSDGGLDLGPAVEDQIHTDLIDLALLSADLRVRDQGDNPSARQAAAERLGEAERLLGPSPVLTRVRESLRTGTEPATAVAGEGLSAWDLYALGRFRLNRGDSAGATNLLRRAVAREPRAFWPNFYLALAAHRQNNPAEAVSGFSVCLAVAQTRHGLCHYNRAVAYEALGDLEAAGRDLDRALELEPDLAAAAFRRGVIRFKLGRLAEADSDLEHALRAGYSPATVWYHLALVRRAAGDYPRAAACAAEASRLNPSDARIRAVLAELQRAGPRTGKNSP